MPCFLCVSFRGPWRSPWGFLWLLRGAVSRRHLRGDPTKADLVLRPQSAHPVRAALLHDSAGLPAACKLRGEDQPGWERHWATDKMLVLFCFTVSSWSLPGWISFLLLSLRRLFSPGVLYLLPGITVLLSLTVFMLMVAEIMPATSDSVPLIGQFLHAFMRMFLWIEPSCILFFRGWCVNSYLVKTVYSYWKWKVLSLHLP